MGNLSFEHEGGGWKEADWLVIPFACSVQVAACSIVSRLSLFRASRSTMNLAPHFEIPGRVDARSGMTVAAI
jgi:hypothetical protein